MKDKTVLLSTQPRWCAKIADREKQWEIRKGRPTQEVPFKVYIYCTKGEKPLSLVQDNHNKNSLLYCYIGDNSGTDIFLVVK